MALEVPVPVEPSVSVAPPLLVRWYPVAEELLAVRRDMATDALRLGFVAAAAEKMARSPPELGMPLPLDGVQLDGALQSVPVLFHV